MRRVGALWKPREGGKSKGSGSITVNGMRQRFVILVNDHKRNSRDPDYSLMSSEDPEPDPYAARNASAGSAPAAQAEQPEPSDADDDIPF